MKGGHWSPPYNFSLRKSQTLPNVVALSKNRELIFYQSAWNLNLFLEQENSSLSLDFLIMSMEAHWRYIFTEKMYVNSKIGEKSARHIYTSPRLVFSVLYVKLKETSFKKCGYKNLIEVKKRYIYTF